MITMHTLLYDPRMAAHKHGLLLKAFYYSRMWRVLSRETRSREWQGLHPNMRHILIIGAIIERDRRMGKVYLE